MSKKLKVETVGTEEIKGIDISPDCSYGMTFYKDNKNVGRLYWDNGVMKFKGLTTQSAQIFFDYLLGMLINPYVKAKLAKTQTPMDKGQNVKV